MSKARFGSEHLRIIFLIAFSFAANSEVMAAAIDGVCGPSAQIPVAIKPSTNLCYLGTASAVTGTDPWVWSCAGSNGGATAVCLAPLLVNGACGTSNNSTFANAPSTNICSSGLASSPFGIGPWSWSCTGSNGGSSASCSANTSSLTKGIPASGSCGSANNTNAIIMPTANLCLTGLPTTALGTGPWSWSCTGNNGGSSASCSSKPIITASVELDLNSPTGTIVTPAAFGANITIVPQMTTPQYQQAMKQMNWPFLRVNGQDSLLGYTFPSRNAANGTVAPNWWKIDQLKTLPSFFSGKLMVTVGGPPNPAIFGGWAAQPFNITDPKDQALYAKMVAQIAQRLKSNGIKVTYWVSLNEPNIAWYNKNISYPQLLGAECNIASATSTALKAIDPSYIFGGPDLDFWGTNSAWTYDFSKCTALSAGFSSYHTYGTSTEAPYDVLQLMKNILGLNPAAPRTYLNGALDITKAVRTFSGTWPVMLTEYNMNGAWQPSDPLQATITGAVYNSLAVSQAILGGVEVASIWEAFNDGTFGVIDGNYVVHPTGYILMKMKQSLPGQVIYSKILPTSATQPVNVNVFATKNANGGYALMLINYDQIEDAHVRITMEGLTNTTNITRYELSAKQPSGTTNGIAASGLNNLLVPANSVVILTPAI